MRLAIIINYTYILAFHLSHGCSFPVRTAGSDNHVYHIYYMTDLLRHLLHFVDQLTASSSRFGRKNIIGTWPSVWKDNQGLIPLYITYTATLTPLVPIIHSNFLMVQVHFQYDLILTKSTNSTHLFKHYHPQAYKAWAYKVC